jgi:N-acetylmuramic acid 6-phosphate etherase
MAGGDAALIKSVEDFEDHPEFAEQQLVELGFKQGDLLIGSTEGGETPWVIGAIWKSTTLTSRKPWMLYGNTD